MIKVSDIAEYINSVCPQSLSFDGDNVGHIVGRAEKEVNKILVTLDVDEYVVREAIEQGADLIVSHHPLMFHAIRRLTDSDPMQKTLMLLIQNDISLISAHTNLDCVAGGLNDYLAEKLGIKNTSVIEVVDEFDMRQHGYGRVGEVPDGTTLADMLAVCTGALGIDAVKYVGDPNRTVKKVAVNCGGGAGEMDICIGLGVDLFITGDVKYNPARDAYESGMAVIDAGHYETEHIVIDLLCDILSKAFSDITYVKSQANIPVIKYFVR